MKVLIRLGGCGCEVVYESHLWLIEEAATTLKPTLFRIPDLTGKTWKLQPKHVDMSHCFLLFEEERRSTSLPGVRENMGQTEQSERNAVFIDSYWLFCMTNVFGAKPVRNLQCETML